MNEPCLNTDEKQLRWQADNDYAWDGMADRRAYLQAALRLLDEARSGGPSPRGDLDPVSDYNPTDDELRIVADERNGPWEPGLIRDLARLVLREREKARTRLEIEQRRPEVESLLRWKAEATTALHGWEGVWRELGEPGPLGSFKWESCVAEIRRRKAALARDREEASRG